MSKESSKDLKLFSEIDTVIGNYRTRYVELQMGLTYSQYQTLRTIDFYSNSKYLFGNTDGLGREKPFYNIGNFRVNVAMRATDIDIKDCVVTADKPSAYVESMILNHELYEWMKEADFDLTLNEIGSTAPRYGGVLVKKCIEEDEDGNEELTIEVPQWKNIITDQINIEGGIKIERHWLTPKEVWDKDGVWENIPEAVALASKIRQNVTNNGVNTQGNDKRVQIFDVEGWFADDMNPMEGTSDSEGKYRLMHFIIATNNNEYVLMYSEELKESQYKYWAWNEVAGRGLGRGVIEDGFEAQVWVNDAIISQKNAIDLSGKVILKTNSKKIGNNILTDADNGRIFELEDGKDITPINLNPGTLPEFGVLLSQWDTQFERVSSTFNAITGEQMPSGSPYRQTAMLNNEASSLFDYRREEKAIFIAEILNDWVLPWLIKKLQKEHILVSDFDDEELQKIDEAFSHFMAREDFVNKVIAGEDVSMEGYLANMELVKQGVIKTYGKRRYLQIPKNFFKDFEGKVSINIAGELKNKNATLESLNNIMMTVAKVPQVLTDPNLKGVFNQIMELSGVMSPVSISNVQAPQAMPQTGAMPTAPVNPVA